MATLVCSKVTIGGPPYQTENYLYIDYSTVDSPSTNQTTVYWHAYFHFTYADARLYDLTINVHGERIRNTGTVHSYGGNFTTRNIDFGGGNFVVNHNSAGEASIGISGSVNVDGVVSSGSTTLTLSNYNRSANTPSMGTTTRDSPTSATVRYNQNGSVNGPTTYVVQRSINNFSSSVDKEWTNPATEFTDSTLESNKTYSYRVYAVGDEGTAKYSANPQLNLYGQPDPPQSVSASHIVNSKDRVQINFSAPSYTGSGISSYTITRNGTPSATFTGITSSPYYDIDTSKIAGNDYSYTVQAVASFTSGGANTGSVKSYDTPAAPTTVPDVSNLGLNITVVSAAIASSGGLTINPSNINEGYFVQYQFADTLDGSYGYGGSAGSWSPAVKMNDQVTRTHVYEMMTPAKFYKFRTYAANTVIYGTDGLSRIAYPHQNITYTSGVSFAANDTGYFLSSGGKRWDGDQWNPTKTARRYTGDAWTPLVTAKRYSGSVWENLN